MLVVVAAAPEYAAGNAPDPVGQGRRQKPAVCVKAGIDIIMRSDVVVGQRLQIAVLNPQTLRPGAQPVEPLQARQPGYYGPHRNRR
jgi:hypothetical protein